MFQKTKLPRRVKHDLKHQDWRVRKEAVNHLQQVVPEVALPNLAQALRDENDFVGRVACGLLEKIGSLALPVLLNATTDKTVNVRAWVVFTLGKIKDERVVPALLPLVFDSKEAVQYRAFQALRAHRDPRVIPVMREILKESDKRRRDEALQTLMPFGDIELLPLCLNIIETEEPAKYKIPDSVRLAASMIVHMGERALSTLFRLTQDHRAHVRKYVAEALGSLHSTSANPHLIALLKDEVDVRVAAMNALGWPGNKEAVQPLLEMQNDTSPDVQNGLPWALGNTGDLAVIPFLIQGLYRDQFNMEGGLYRQAMAFWQWTDRTVEVIPMAIQAIRTEQDQRLRISAVWLLHTPLGDYPALVENWRKAKKPLKQLEIPDVYRNTLDVLLEAMVDDNPDVRLSALSAQYMELKDKRIGRALAARLSDDRLPIAYKAAERLLHNPDKRALPNLYGALERPDEKLQRLCLPVLGTIGQTKALPIILSKLNHPSESIRYAAVSALGATRDPSVLPILIERFGQEQDFWIRSGIVLSIHNLKDKNAIPFLLSVLDIQFNGRDFWDETPQLTAVMALSALDAQEGIPMLLRKLDENGDRGGMVNVLVKALGHIGPDSEQLPRLFGLLTHSSSYVRGQAATELGYIGAAIRDLAARDRLVQELIRILYDTGHALHYAVPLVGDAVAKSLYYIGTPEARVGVKDWDEHRATIIANLQKSSGNSPER